MSVLALGVFSFSSGWRQAGERNKETKRFVFVLFVWRTGSGGYPWPRRGGWGGRVKLSVSVNNTTQIPRKGTQIQKKGGRKIFQGEGGAWRQKTTWKGDPDSNLGLRQKPWVYRQWINLPVAGSVSRLPCSIQVALRSALGIQTTALTRRLVVVVTLCLPRIAWQTLNTPPKRNAEMTGAFAASN